MSNTLTPFMYEGTLAVRVHQDEAGNPWFVARDVCECLGIQNPRDALSRLDDDEKGVGITDTLGGAQELSTVNESGVYSLIFTSRKPEAKAFKRWVTKEVLPTIRKTGSYIAPHSLKPAEILRFKNQRHAIERQLLKAFNPAYRASLIDTLSYIYHVLGEPLPDTDDLAPPYLQGRLALLGNHPQKQ